MDDGTTDKAKGRVKEAGGDLTDDQDLRTRASSTKAKEA